MDFLTPKFTEKRLSSETIFEGRVFTVKKDYAEIQTGETKLREIVIHPGGVVIAAITEEQKVLMVRQYRYPLGQELIEFPAGKLEPNEDPDVTAKRELLEETGCTAKHWEKLAVTFATPGFCNETLHLYKATGLTMNAPQTEDGEILEHFEAPLEEVKQLVKDGKIQDLKTIALLGLISM